MSGFQTPTRGASRRFNSSSEAFKQALRNRVNKVKGIQRSPGDDPGWLGNLLEGLILKRPQAKVPNSE